MREGFSSEKLARKLLLRGFSPGFVLGAVREIQEHWEDLRREGLEEGLSACKAEKLAREKIGDADMLAACITEKLRGASWISRHAVVSFALFPFVAVMIWWALFCYITGWTSGALQWSENKSLPPPDWQLVIRSFDWIATGAALILPMIFCWLASRSCAGFKAAFLACFLLSIHHALHFVALNLPSPVANETITFTMGYTAHANPFQNNFAGFSIPLLVFALFVLFRVRTKTERLKEMYENIG